jgi:hypothetical protein
MQCKCGVEMKYAIHNVSTTRGKKKWLDESVEDEITIQQWDCSMCERHIHKVWVNNTMIKRFG